MDDSPGLQGKGEEELHPTFGLVEATFRYRRGGALVVGGWPVDVQAAILADFVIGDAFVWPASQYLTEPLLAKPVPNVQGALLQVGR